MQAPLLTRRLADALWAEAQPALAARPPSPRPTLVVLAGVPLSGKSTLGRALAETAATATLHIENDAVRLRLAGFLERPLPAHDPEENYLTYRATWSLAERALAARANAVHDGTNLTESGRRGAYDAAERAGAACVVVFVATPDDVVAERAAQALPERFAAYAKLGQRQPAPQASRPFVALDGARPAAENLAALRAVPELAALWN